MTKPATVARFSMPSLPMGGCIFAAIERDTRGTLLSDAQRFNYYPATPLALISWVFEGDLHMVERVHGEPGCQRLGPPLPRLVFSGPQREPCTSWSPAAVHALSVAFYPDALAQLIGQPLEPYFDATLPAADVLGADLLAACEGVFERPAGTPPTLADVEACLLPFWAGRHARSAAPWLGDWLRTLAVRAAYSKSGTSARQLQLRVKSWAGQSYRDLQLYARVEAAFAQSSATHREEADNLAELAYSAGFADQSHMGRDVRRITGVSPGRFRQLIDGEESFWFYRLIEGQFRTAGQPPATSNQP